MLSLRHSDALTDLSNREIHVTEADVVTWQGLRALHLVNGLALLPGELSDELVLTLDGKPIHSGSNAFRSTGPYEDRGYILPGAERVHAGIGAGKHVLGARVRTVEPFGWGLTVALAAGGVSEEA